MLTNVLIPIAGVGLTRTGITFAVNQAYPFTWTGLHKFDGGIATSPTVDLNIAPGGNVVLDPVGNNVLPATAYDLNIGSAAKKFLSLHAAELWVETLVAQDTLATIGGRVLVGPTTTLTADVGVADTTIVVKHNNLANGDRVYLECNGSLEFMAIASTPSGTGPYTYNVTRDLDGSGANVWRAGDAVFNTGTTGKGFIDLYSLRGVKSASQVGPTVVGNVRNSSAYNDWTEHWALGNLNGLYGYGADTYGFAAGKYAANSPWISVDATNGFRVMRGAGPATQLAQWDTSGNILVGQVAAGQSNVYISAGAVDIRNNTTARIHLAADGSGYVANANVYWDATGNFVINGSATIAGWTVNGAYFAKDTGTNATSSGMAPVDYPFYAGATYANRASAPFRVTPAGALYASSATISGTITATSGSIGGWTINSSSLTATGVGLAPGTYPFYAGNATPASAPFRVDSAGNLTATAASIAGAITASSGSIGGFTIGASTLTAGSGSSAVGLAPGTYPFYAGNATPASAPFRVTAAGALYASSATISGAITATSGSIGGWTIGSTLTAGSGSSAVGLAPGTYPFYAGNSDPASAPFRVTTAGALTATSVSISVASGAATLDSSGLTLSATAVADFDSIPSAQLVKFYSSGQSANVAALGAWAYSVASPYMNLAQLKSYQRTAGGNTYYASTRLYANAAYLNLHEATSSAGAGITTNVGIATSGALVVGSASQLVLDGKVAGTVYASDGGGHGQYGADTRADLMADCYYSSGWKYRTTGAAQLLEMSTKSGVVGFYYANAGSHAAGDAITWAQIVSIGSQGELAFGGQTSWDANYFFLGPNNSARKAKAYAWDTYSDGRIKKDLAPIVDPLWKVRQLQPYRFLQFDSVWGPAGLELHGEGREQIGLVAQEVASIVPQVVNRPVDDSRELWGLDYGRLVPVLIAAIQEQQTQIDRQHTEIEELRRMVA